MRYSLLIALTLLAPVFPQAPKPQTTQKLPGVMEGRVVNDKTGEPIRRVVISARASSTSGTTMGGPANYTATTDAEGKFRIETVAPGTYLLTAERQGFIRKYYGGKDLLQASGSFTLTPVKVAAEQVVKDLDFKMIPQGLVAGRVLDEEGEPLARAQVQVLARRYYNGKSQLQPAGTAQSNDLGEFRISDLAPGRYWVSSSLRDQPTAPNTRGKPEEAYVTTFHPNAKESSVAQQVEVAAGQQLNGVDIRMQKSQVYRIRGKVLGEQPAEGIGVRAIANNHSLAFGTFGPSTYSVKPDGTFELTGVAPGSYFVMAVSKTPGRQFSLGKITVEVTREMVENLMIPIGNPVKVTGILKIESERQVGNELLTGNMRVQLTPFEGGLSSSDSTLAKPDGSWIFEKMSLDKYRFQIFPLPLIYYVKSIRVGDQEVLDTGLDLNGGGTTAVEILLATGTGSINGKVQDAKQQPAAKGSVALVPDPLKESRFDLYHLSTIGPNGQFTIQGIAPGNYKLYAWEEMEAGAYQDSDFLKKYEGKGQPVSIKLKGKEEVTLKLIPSENLGQ